MESENAFCACSRFAALALTRKLNEITMLSPLLVKCYQHVFSFCEQTAQAIGKLSTQKVQKGLIQLTFPLHLI